MRKHGERAQTSIPVAEIGGIAGSDPIAIDVLAFFSACPTRHAVLAIDAPFANRLTWRGGAAEQTNFVFTGQVSTEPGRYSRDGRPTILYTAIHQKICRLHSPAMTRAGRLLRFDETTFTNA